MGEMAGWTSHYWDGTGSLGNWFTHGVWITKDRYAEDARYILDVGSRASGFQGLSGGQSP
jgi:hypothetical protein